MFGEKVGEKKRARAITSTLASLFVSLLIISAPTWADGNAAFEMGTAESKTAPAITSAFLKQHLGK